MQILIFQRLRRVVVLFLLGTALGILASPNSYCQQPKVPYAWQPGYKKWPDWLEETAKRLEKSKSMGQPTPEIEFLQARASELLERAKLSRENFFRFSRYIAATNALLEAGDKLFWLRKIERLPQEQDYWDAGPVLQFCHFRVKQADFFAPRSGEKNADQYVTWSRSLYQQARSANDAREYQRARLLGDAASFIVLSLEFIVQAVFMPDAPIPK
jgi:hypothetical protein